MEDIMFALATGIGSDREKVTRELFTVCGTLIMTGSHCWMLDNSFLWSIMFEISKLIRMLEFPYLSAGILEMIENKRKVTKSLSNLMFSQQDSF